jgi:hypothetical protein
VSDRDALDTLTAEARRETSQAEQIIKEVTGGMPARSPKLHEWLGEHGVHWQSWPGARTDTGKPSPAKTTSNSCSGTRSIRLPAQPRRKTRSPLPASRIGNQR